MDYLGETIGCFGGEAARVEPLPRDTGQRAETSRVDAGHHRFEEIPCRAEGVIGLPLHPGGTQHQEAAPAGQVGGGIQQCRLANPGRAEGDHAAPSANFR